jgi:uncharacterized membrane protein YphA (DoxX/SURF4 family)
LQRLFSTFPNGWPGFGLLLLRLGLAARLIYLGTTALSAASDSIHLTPHLISIGGAIFLLIGLWTPLIGALLAADQVCIALQLYVPQQAQSWIHTFLAVLSASVAMLGPGAWSIDARLFGRRRFEIGSTRGKKASL